MKYMYSITVMFGGTVINYESSYKCYYFMGNTTYSIKYIVDISTIVDIYIYI